MPKFKTHAPAWADFANVAVENLHIHHGLRTPYSDNTKNKMEPVSELDELFARFGGNENNAQFGSVLDAPSRYVPARQLMMAVRLAAAFGGSDTYVKSTHCGALTVIGDIPLEDLALVKETLKRALPHAGWQVVSPDMTDGGLSRTAQDRFGTAIADHIDRIEPVLILQARGVSLPRHSLAIASPILPLPPISRDIVTFYMSVGQHADQIPDRTALRNALPNDDDLSELSTLDVCAALRAPTPRLALGRLDAMIDREAKATGPRLQDFSGETPAIVAARRIVDDLLLWKQGKAGWDEISRSLLLYGPPGTGKTFLARAIGNSAGIAVVNAGFADWQAKGHLGNMLAAMKASFAEARRLAPAALIIDEFDAVGSRSDTDRHAMNYRLQVINSFLGEMDSIAREEGVIVIGTCNHPERIDPALLRAGRLDLKVRVPLPDADAILGILRHHLREDIADGELQILSHLAVGRSAADIDAAIRAARSDARHQRALLSIEMLHEQMGIDITGADDKILWRVAVHEAGHAVVGKALGLGAIDSITVTNSGGQIHRRNVTNENLLSDIEAEITYGLAGRAAERLILGEISAGAGGPAQSDLATATQLAIEIETTLGLGVEGLVWHAKPQIVHLQTPAVRDRVRQRLTRAEQRAEDLLAQHRETLEALARELVGKRSLRTRDVDHLLRGIALQTNAPTVPPCAKTDHQNPM